MSIDGEAILRYVQADKDLDDKVGPALLQAIQEVEDKYGIRIAELRVSVDPSHRGNGWPGVNCVIVRERAKAR